MAVSVAEKYAEQITSTNKIKSKVLVAILSKVEETRVAEEPQLIRQFAAGVKRHSGYNSTSRTKRLPK